MSRQTKTPAQRAQEALNVAERRCKRLSDAIEHQRSILADYERQHADAERRRRYVSQNPDLPRDLPELVVTDPETEHE